MMKPCSPLIVFLLVLHLLLSGAYGARLGIFSFKSLIHTVEQTQSTFLGNSNSNYDDVVKKHGVDQDVSVREKIQVVCEDEDHCASKGDDRKLFTMATVPTSNTETIQKKLVKGASKVEMRSSNEVPNNNSWSSRRINKEDEEVMVTPNKYNEDLIAMTEMDYSPAKRRPPIHN